MLEWDGIGRWRWLSEGIGLGIWMQMWNMWGVLDIVEVDGGWGEPDSWFGGIGRVGVCGGQRDNVGCGGGREGLRGRCGQDGGGVGGVGHVGGERMVGRGDVLWGWAKGLFNTGKSV